MNYLVDLRDKHILIIGGLSEIGVKTAETLCKLGASVDIADIADSVDEDIVNNLQGEDNHYFQLDVSNIESINTVIKEAVSRYGRYDGMVYSAEEYKHISMETLTPEELKKQFDINYFGFFEAVRQITASDRYNPGMRIVGLSSVASLKGKEAYSGYSAAKAAMDGTVRAMGIELAPKGICINTVIAGVIDSGAFGDYKDNVSGDSLDAEILEERQSLGIGKAEDVAEPIAFLISSASRFITGQSVVVDGGYTA